jgi:hypothetical protein
MSIINRSIQRPGKYTRPVHGARSTGYLRRNITVGEGIHQFVYDDIPGDHRKYLRHVDEEPLCQQ